MARRWHEPVPRAERVRRVVALYLPLAIACAGIGVTAEEVFPRQSNVGLLLVAIFALAAAAAWGVRRFAPPEVVAQVPDPATRVLDIETGLGNARLLMTLLRSEVARAKRYGHRSVLSVIEVAPTGFRPIDPAERAPSPGKFVAMVLLRCVRQGDMVVRIDDTRFALLLVECNDAGVEALEPRILQELTAMPYARNDDGSAIFLKARASHAAYDNSMETAEEYFAHALGSTGEARPRAQAFARERAAG